MIDWRIEVNTSLKKIGVTTELNYSAAVQFVIELYTKHNKSLLWFQNVFFENRVSWFGVRLLLLSENICLKHRGGKNRKEFTCPLEELRSCKMIEISQKYNVSMSTVNKQRRKHNVTRKSRGAQPVEEEPGPAVDRLDERKRGQGPPRNQLDYKHH